MEHRHVTLVGEPLTVADLVAALQGIPPETPVFTDRDEETMTPLGVFTGPSCDATSCQGVTPPGWDQKPYVLIGQQNGASPRLRHHHLPPAGWAEDVLRRSTGYQTKVDDRMVTVPPETIPSGLVEQARGVIAARSATR